MDYLDLIFLSSKLAFDDVLELKVIWEKKNIFVSPQKENFFELLKIQTNSKIDTIYLNIEKIKQMKTIWNIKKKKKKMKSQTLQNI